LGSPPGLVAVFTIRGGTALMITAFCTRLSPCARQVVHDFAAAGRSGDMHRTLEVEMRASAPPAVVGRN